MHIDQYISELLYDFECVVLPGLGGFIANDHSATINKINHHFSPPFRKLVFNKHLKANDGLLINHIAKAENITYKEARKKVEQFIASCLGDLQDNHVVRFENIGQLHYDNNRNLVFEQDERINYHPDAFGLSDFVSPVIKRTRDEEKLKGVIFPKQTAKSIRTDRKTKIGKTGKRNFRVVSYVAAVLLLLIGFGWGYFNKEKINAYWENQASLLQFVVWNSSHSTVTSQAHRSAQLTLKDNPETNENKEPVSPADVELNKVAKSNAVNHPEETKKPNPVKDNNIVKPDKTKLISPEKLSVKTYYIIAGSFSSEKNAGRLISQLKQQGFEAVMAGTSKTGMYRVAYTAVEGRAEANRKLYAIRRDNNPDAWMLRKH